MDLYRNLNIRMKMIVGFVTIAVLAAVMGLTGIISMSSIAKNNEAIYSHSAVPITYLSQIQTAFQQSRVSVRDMIRANETKIIEEQVTIISAERVEATSVMTLLEEAISGEKSTAAFAAFSNARTEYGKQLDAIIELGRKNGDGTAYAMIAPQTTNSVGQVVPAGEFTLAATKYVESFQMLETAMLDSAQTLVSQSASSASGSLIVMVVLVILVAGLAVLVGLYVSNSISQPLQKSLNMIQEMSKGHLSIRLGITSRDEVGRMAQAMDAFADDMQNVVIGTMKRIADGDMTASIEPHDDKDEIAPALKTTISNVRSLIAETNTLIEAAVEGRLDTRANTKRFQGGWKDLLTGFNKVLETVVLPINEASAVLIEMSKGNLGLRMDGDYKGDYAVIKKSMNDTLDAISGYVSEISSVLTEMAGSNMDVSINGDYRGDFAAIKEALNLIADNFNRILYDMNTASDQVAAGSRQVSDGSQALSQGATEQASSVEELTASINEIADQTRHNALSANEANELAGTAHIAATQGNSRMKEMQKAMEEINESSTSISKIIKVIDEIAFQTNILALNAAVEAAHAGQHGKGFAVVAEEVRNLAARSAAAAKETTGLIEGSIKKVEIGTRIANDTAQALDRIVTDVAKAAELVGSIAVASNEQATGIAQINQGVEQVSKVVQANSATAEQSAQASEELSGQAELLKGMIDRFQIREVRADAAPVKRAAAAPVRKPDVREANSEAGQNADAASREAAAKLSKPGDKGKPAAVSASKPKIILSDNEFGKY